MGSLHKGKSGAVSSLSAMNAGSEQVSKADVVRDLASIRRLRWRNSKAIANLSALYLLLPANGRPDRDDHEDVRDAMQKMLSEFVADLTAQEALNPPALDQSLSVAATQLFRLDDETADLDVKEILPVITETWKVFDRKVNAEDWMEPSTFRKNHLKGVTEELGRRLLNWSNQREDGTQRGENVSSAADVASSVSGNQHADQRQSPTASVTKRHQTWNILYAILATLAAVIFIVLAVADREPEIPKRGSIVDAQTGKVHAPDSIEPVATTGPEGGDIVRGCVLATTPVCRGDGFATNDSPLRVHTGDVIRVLIRLHNPYNTTISMLRIMATPVVDQRGALLDVSWEWPTLSSDATNKLDFESDGDSVPVQFAGDGRQKLELVEGSSGLYTGERPKRLIAKLPDGIVDMGGIKIARLGSPKDCWNCDLEYTRFVQFDMRVG